MDTNDELFAKWWNTAEPYVRAYSRRVGIAALGSAVDESDLVQIVAMHMFRRYREMGLEFESERHFSSLALYVARSVFIDQTRSYHAVKRGGASRASSTIGSSDQVVDTSSKTPHYAVEVDEMFQRAMHAIRSLEEHEPTRSTVLRAYLGGRSYREIAGLAGVSVYRVRKIITEVMAELRDSL